jgi:cytochrome c biogenesis protein CcdA
LACTGQVYLPTIIFVSSIPELRLQAVLYLIIYNLLFILPLVVIFILVYLGTTSKDLTTFLQGKAAAVKLAMAFVFISLGGWLIFSLFS